jgi:glycosyltransferase involved in cell wall biosynthesis
MAYGLPVVASNCTAQENVINASECGLVHEAGNAADLAGKIRMLEDDVKYRKFSTNGKEAVRIKYNFEVSKKKLVGLYSKIEHEIQGDQAT